MGPHQAWIVTRHAAAAGRQRNPRHRAWRTVLACGTLVCVMAAAAPDRRPPGRETMSDKTILLLQQDINSLTTGASDAVLYGRAADADWLRQIAVATRASVQAQVEMLRQQHEIIRLLEQLQRGRETTR